MQVKIAEDFQKITEEVTAFLPDLILMELKLPYYNGFYWCEEIRKTSRVPVVFLSSADDNMNIVMAMNMGADDFIPKPFDLQVLTAKLQAVLRRSYGTPLSGHLMECGDLVLEQCSLMKMTKQVVKKYSTLFIYNHIAVHLENLDHVVLTDEKWFSFLLEQILSNALKYTKEGSVHILAKDCDGASGRAL